MSTATAADHPRSIFELAGLSHVLALKSVLGLTGDPITAVEVVMSMGASYIANGLLDLQLARQEVP